jgi:uncharacterized protein YbjT (DUF2867 family)
MKTLIIGGTGQVGSLVTTGLLAQGAAVRVLTRDAKKAEPFAKAEPFVGDLNKPTTTAEAFKGIDTVFMLNTVSPTEANEGLTAVTQARQAGVKKFVYMGVHNAAGAAFLPHFGVKVAVEQALKVSGFSWTSLHPNNFFQNDVWFKDVMLQHGVYPQPIGDKGLHRVDTRDIADAAVNALTKPGFENKAYVLAGPQLMSGNSTAEIWSTALGKKIAYGGNDLDAWSKAMSAMLPETMLFDFRAMYAFFQEKGLAATAGELADCEKIVGHPLRTFDAYAKETAAGWTR